MAEKHNKSEKREDHLSPTPDIPLGLLRRLENRQARGPRRRAPAARACTSAAPMSAACTIASSRCWTIPSTSISPATAPHRGDHPRRRLLLHPGQRPRHPRGHHPKFKIPGHGTGADQSACRRKIRPGRLTNISGGLHGVGAKCVNALSEWFKVEVTRDGKVYQMAFERGKTTQKLTSSAR